MKEPRQCARARLVRIQGSLWDANEDIHIHIMWVNDLCKGLNSNRMMHVLVLCGYETRAKASCTLKVDNTVEGRLVGSKRHKICRRYKRYRFVGVIVSLFWSCGAQIPHRVLRWRDLCVLWDKRIMNSLWSHPLLTSSTRGFSSRN